MRERIQTWMKNFGIALARTLLESDEVLPFVLGIAVVAVGIAFFVSIGSDICLGLGRSGAEILSINPDKVFPS